MKHAYIRLVLSSLFWETLGLYFRSQIAHEGNPTCQCSPERPCVRYSDVVRNYWEDPGFSGCDLSTGISPGKTQYCLQPQGTLPAMYVFGDSHAAHLEVGVRAAIVGRYQLRPLYFSSKGLTDPSYVELARTTLQSQLRPGDVVVISQAFWYDYASLIIPNILKLQVVTSTKGASLLLMGDFACNIYNKIQAISCKPHDIEKCMVPRAQAEADLIHQQTMYQQLSVSHPDVKYFDPHGFFCDATHCGPVFPSTRHSSPVIGMDSCHLTSDGSYSLWPALCGLFNGPHQQAR